MIENTSVTTQEARFAKLSLAARNFVDAAAASPTMTNEALLLMESFLKHHLSPEDSKCPAAANSPPAVHNQMKESGNREQKCSPEAQEGERAKKKAKLSSSGTVVNAGTETFYDVSEL